MLKDLQSELAKFRFTESAEISEKEIETLKEMFSVKDSFKTLFRYFCVIEGEKGTQLAYDIEALPVLGQYTAEEVADEIKFKQLLTRLLRMKMETIRNDFEKKSSEKVDEAEKKVLEEREKNKKEQEEADMAKRGVSPDM